MFTVTLRYVTLSEEITLENNTVYTRLLISFGAFFHAQLFGYRTCYRYFFHHFL